MKELNHLTESEIDNLQPGRETDALAGLARGWQKEKDPEELYSYVWTSADGEFQYSFDDWTPSEELGQAMELADELMDSTSCKLILECESEKCLAKFLTADAEFSANGSGEFAKELAVLKVCLKAIVLK